MSKKNWVMRAGRAGVDLGLQHVDVVLERRALRVHLRIEADRDLERRDRADAGGELGGVGVAVGAGR